MQEQKLQVIEGKATLRVIQADLEDGRVLGTVALCSDSPSGSQVFSLRVQASAWCFRGDWVLLEPGREVFTKEIGHLSADEQWVDFVFELPEFAAPTTAIVRLTVIPDLTNTNLQVEQEAAEVYYTYRDPKVQSPLSAYTDRKAAAQRTRRIIYNNDGNDNPSLPVTPISFLQRRTLGLEYTQVDTISYCTGIFNLYTHHSDETELHYSTGSTPPEAVSWALLLKEQGFDPLQLMIDYARVHGKEIWWSMRMNDTHDNQAKREDWQLSQWKREHRHLLMAPVRTQFPYGWQAGPSWTYTALNYEHEEVRNKVYSIIADVCTRYDLDGIELDFFRHPVFFRPQMFGEPVTDEQRGLMTDLLRRIRDLTEEIAKERGRPFLVVVRVPDSVGYAKEIGLDVVEWLEQDLVDIIIAAGIFRLEPWENSVDLGRRYDVPVYASLSTSRLGGYLEVWREEALQAWEAGCSGIATFNVFQPNSPLLRQLGDPGLLRNLPRTTSYSVDEDIMRSLRSISSFLKGGERFLDPAVAALYPPEAVAEILAGP
ncbi:MAG TPA: family 10 glycosylhydrolase [Firmicutes bacterium]|nr:family 10 glycosylhydrolase [Bacillota bacterium]